MSRITLTLVLFLCGHTSTSLFAFEENARDAKQHLIENPNATWNLDVKLNHSNGFYRIGEELRLSVKSPRKCHLHIISINPQGELSVLWPLNAKSSSLVEANEEIALPNAHSEPSLKFQATAPVGKELIICFATTRPLNLQQEKDKKRFTQFLEGVTKVLPSNIARIKSFVSMVEQDELGWTGKAVEITTAE